MSKTADEEAKTKFLKLKKALVKLPKPQKQNLTATSAKPGLKKQKAAKLTLNAKTTKTLAKT